MNTKRSYKVSRSSAPVFQGVIFDGLDEVILERSPVLRSNYNDAMADALALVSSNENKGWWGKTNAYVLRDGILMHDEEVSF